MSSKLWVLTREHNLYDQEGDYFVSVWLTKPTRTQIYDLLVEDDQVNVNDNIADHIFNGGGREGVEEVWYNLIKVSEGGS